MLREYGFAEAAIANALGKKTIYARGSDLTLNMKGSEDEGATIEQRGTLSAMAPGSKKTILTQR
jgi:hypothetical protein